MNFKNLVSSLFTYKPEEKYDFVLLYYTNNFKST